MNPSVRNPLPMLLFALTTSVCTRKVELELRQVLRLPRNVALELHQVLRQPREVTLELHAAYYLAIPIT